MLTLVECWSWFWVVGKKLQSFKRLRFEIECWPVVAVSSGLQQDSHEKPGAAGKKRGMNPSHFNKAYKFYSKLALSCVCTVHICVSLSCQFKICLPENKCSFLQILLSLPKRKTYIWTKVYSISMVWLMEWWIFLFHHIFSNFDLFVCNWNFFFPFQPKDSKD